MTLSRLLTRIAALVMVLGAAQAHADTMSLAEQQQEAERLKDLCAQQSDVARYTDEARSGSVRATYLAAAALLQCFYDNVDSRYPEELKSQWLEAIRKNQDQAEQLNQ